MVYNIRSKVLILKRKFTFFKVFVFFHFTLVLSISTKSIIDGHQKFYGESSTLLIFDSVDRLVTNLIRHSLIRDYLKFSGTNTGYGFFAPNVSSEVVTLYKLIKSNNELDTILNPHFKVRESYLKYSSSLGFYIDIMLADSLNTKYEEEKTLAHILTRCLAKHMLKNHSEIDTVELQILVYHFPTLLEYNSGVKEARYFLLDSVKVHN